MATDDTDDEPAVRWERPPPRYRPGRGGFDPEEDAEKARARYAFRQRIVLTLLVCALLTGVAAAAAFPVGWGAHGAIDLALNRARVLLDLPAAVSRAGVLDDEPETGHDTARSLSADGAVGADRAR